MLELAPKPSHLTDQFDSIRGLLASYGPPDLMELRDRALAEFSEFGIPTTKDEEFKYVSLKVLEEGLFQPAYGATVTRAEMEGTPVGKIDALTISFVNGQYAPELSTEGAFPEGVVIGTLLSGFEERPDVMRTWLSTVATLRGKLGSTNDERFVALNSAFLSEGAFVYVPRGLAVGGGRRSMMRRCR